MSRPTFFALLLAGAIALPAAAQIDEDIQTGIPVSGFSTNRSSLFVVAQGDIIVVRVNGPEALDIEASVYNASHELVAKEDPEQPRAAFEYLAPEDGTYYVLGRNISEVSGTMSVYVRRGAKVEPPGGKPLAIVRVFYATNRAPASPVKKSPYYLNEPAAGADYQAGSCYVRIPRNHKLGELETTAAYQIKLFGDRGDDIRILGVDPEPDHARFFAAIGDKAKQAPERQVLVFIHGYNTSFEDAARRTAQLSYDLAFSGASVLFTWPSHHDPRPAEYQDDRKRADASVAILRAFLQELHAQTGATALHVIAHSLGNEILTRALASLSAPAARFRNAVLIAPDIDASALRRISGDISKTASRLTLYTSSRDLALRLSELSGNMPRAGNHIVLAADLETIDASEARTELTNFSHSYFADSPLVLGDLFHLLRGEPPDMRFALDRVCLDRDCRDGRMYWRFRPTSR
jgi:esterase/lipase superfamily enzyme